MRPQQPTSRTPFFFQPVPSDCDAGTCNAFDGSRVCNTEWYGSSCTAHCSGICPTTTGGCATQHPSRAQLVAQVATCKVVPIVLCILRAGRTQTSTLNQRRERARGRDPEVTGALVQIIAPAWECTTTQRASANVTCNTRGRTAARKPW